MSPLEIMAKTHWANSEDIAWENLLPGDREHMLGMMQLALLALAEVQLPGIAYVGGNTIKNSDGNYSEIAQEVFSDMLRYVAGDKQTTTPQNEGTT